MFYKIDPSYINDFGSINQRIPNHPELLETAEKLYVHPTCEISREAIKKKYKKSLSIAGADAVVIPGGSMNDVNVEQRSAMFVNDEAKLILLTHFGMFGEEAENEFNNISQLKGKTFRSFIGPNPPNCLNEYQLNAKLEYTGPIAIFSSKATRILMSQYSAFSESKVVKEPAPANKGNTNGTSVASLIGPVFLKICTSRSISSDMRNIISAPAMANDWISTLNNLRIKSPA